MLTQIFKDWGLTKPLVEFPSREEKLYEKNFREYYYGRRQNYLDPIRYEDSQKSPSTGRVDSRLMKVGGLYKAPSGIEVRIFGKTPEGNLIAIQFRHNGQEMGAYLIMPKLANQMAPIMYEVIHEPPDDENADTDF